MDDDLPDTRFVHPCNCTLIAHEACLLTWIASQQQTKGDRDPGELARPFAANLAADTADTPTSVSVPPAVCCPQCKAEFLIDEVRPPPSSLARASPSRR